MQFTDFKLACELNGFKWGSMGAELYYEEVLAAGQEYHQRVYQERIWVKDRKPYYNIYPSVVEMFSKIRLDFPGKHLKMPLPSLLIRLPATRNLSILLTDQSDHGVILGYICGPEKSIHGSLFLNDVSIEDQLQLSGASDLETLQLALRLIAAVCLLNQDDTNIINPDVLRKDEQKLWEVIDDEEKVQILRDRAFRRRGPGWEIGKRYDLPRGLDRKACYVVPPHPQLYWTGKGRTIPRIQTRSGYVVNRKAIESVPTGRIGIDGPVDIRSN